MTWALRSTLLLVSFHWRLLHARYCIEWVRSIAVNVMFLHEFVMNALSSERDQSATSLSMRLMYCFVYKGVQPPRFRLHFNELQPLLSRLQRNEFLRAASGGRRPIDCLSVFLPLLIWPLYSEQLSCRLACFLYMNYLQFSFSSVLFTSAPLLLAIVLLADVHSAYNIYLRTSVHVSLHLFLYCPCAICISVLLRVRYTETPYFMRFFALASK